MTPAAYVEKPPSFTAVQWDGSDEAATWITDKVTGSHRDGETLSVRDSMDRDSELARESWVVRNDTSATVFMMDDADFTRRFQRAD